MENLRMDSHKLIFHPRRVADWLEGRTVYPITVEISPSGNCNHRCVFCALDYLQYQNRFLEKKLMLDTLKEMQVGGVRSIVLAGEGEPLLNRDTPELIVAAKNQGLDVAMSSNGVLFSEEIALTSLPGLTWIRFSVNGAVAESYQQIHRGNKNDFDRVLSNIARTVEIKKSKGLSVTIGVQFLLLPDNSEGLMEFARLLKGIGTDYLTIKPYSQHPQSSCALGRIEDYDSYQELEQALSSLNNDSFQVIFRSSSMAKLKSYQKAYTRCLGIPFWSYIDAGGEVWPCLAYIGNERFACGNLHQMSYGEIIKSPRYREVVKMISEMDISACRDLCRLEAINEYLHELTYPGEHVNFI